MPLLLDVKILSEYTENYTGTVERDHKPLENSPDNPLDSVLPRFQDLKVKIQGEKKSLW